MPSVHRAPGLTGDWLNGWLAALGITVLVPSARLCFDGDGVPTAVVELDGGIGLDEAVAAALPTTADLEELAIARSRLSQHVFVDDYRQAASAARATRDWSLSSSVTDLGKERNNKGLPHSRFDLPAQGDRPLWVRLIDCRNALGSGDGMQSLIARSLTGRGARIKASGLGFDYRRISAAANGPGKIRVDPVVECLAFYGLALFPVRGDSVHSLTRGWRWHAASRQSRLTWPTWRASLDRFGIDALLGAVFASGDDRSTLTRLGVQALFETITYTPPPLSKDITSGYGSRRLW